MDKRVVSLFAALGVGILILQAVTVTMMLRGQVVLRPVVTNAAPCDDPESPCYMPFIEDQGELGVGGALPKGEGSYPDISFPGQGSPCAYDESGVLLPGQPDC